MKLSISNIGWTSAQDSQVYSLMKKYGFSGLEIAPTRIFPEAPYDRLKEAGDWAEKLKNEQGLFVSSIQSIWYGRQEKIFGTDEERQLLVDYTKKAIDFATAVNCKNLVFGCPGNRGIPDGADEQIGIHFFKEIGDYAANKGTIIGMEANPPTYNTNYINDTYSALELIDKVNSRGFCLNWDIGTVIQNEETVEALRGKVHLINHVHISEPWLQPIQKRQLHCDLKQILIDEKYQGYVSIEMRKTEDFTIVENAIKYVGEMFHDL